MGILDAYYKKTIDYEYKNRTLKFQASQSLFSSYDIDFGTQRLLRTFMDNRTHIGKILDLGCGYGPIGITLKAIDPKNNVHMVDKDVLALEFSRINAELNSVKIPDIYPSLGYDNVTEKYFDLIISNIPARVGQKVLSHLLIDSRYFLDKDGQVAVVVIDAIKKDSEEILNDPSIEIIFKKSWPGHTVFHFKFLHTLAPSRSKPNCFESGVYDRTENEFRFLENNISLKTTFNLPEFDQVSYTTNLLLIDLKRINPRMVAKCVVYNPGQGYIPVALCTLCSPETISLVDRDLQALKVSERNLILNGYSDKKINLFHRVGLGNDANLTANCIVAILDEKEERAVNAIITDQIMDLLAPEGIAFLASSSNVITQVETIAKRHKNIFLQKRFKQKGKSVISFKRT